MADDPLISSLDGSFVPLDRIGGKAASLARLRAMDAPVPRAFALTTDAYRLHAEQIGIPHRASAVAAADLPSVRSAILDAPLAPETRDAIDLAVEAALTDGGASLAVRSSATTEDSPEFSFAGLHDTSLAVAAERDLVDAAVKACWASLWSDRSVDYRRRGDDRLDDAAMAVIIQQLVRADVSFVAFSVDPVDDCAHRTVISASYGLGEAIVAGLVVPDNIVLATDGTVIDYRVGSKETMVIASPNGHGGVRQVSVPRMVAAQHALSDRQVAQIGQLVTRLEHHFGLPIDIEGGFAGEMLWLFQARPVTTCCSSDR